MRIKDYGADKIFRKFDHGIIHIRYRVQPYHRSFTNTTLSCFIFTDALIRAFILSKSRKHWYIRMPKICLYLGSFMTQFLLLTKHIVSGDDEKIATNNESFRSKKNLAKEYIRDVSTLVVGGEVGDINLFLRL
jgi:hypothetical protein